MIMKEKQYIKQLEDKLFELYSLITDRSLYNFLSDSERTKVGTILNEASQARTTYLTSEA